MTERELGRILARLETLHDDIIEIKNLIEAQNGRVRKLETHKNWIVGAGTACLAIFSTVFTYVIRILQ